MSHKTAATVAHTIGIDTGSQWLWSRPPGPVLCKSVTQPDAGDTVPRIDSLNLLHKLGYDT